jgi:hypothetical protein
MSPAISIHSGWTRSCHVSAWAARSSVRKLTSTAQIVHRNTPSSPQDVHSSTHRTALTGQRSEPNFAKQAWGPGRCRFRGRGHGPAPWTPPVRQGRLAAMMPANRPVQPCLLASPDVVCRPGGSTALRLYGFAHCPRRCAERHGLGYRPSATGPAQPAQRNRPSATGPAPPTEPHRLRSPTG